MSNSGSEMTANGQDSAQVSRVAALNQFMGPLTAVLYVVFAAYVFMALTGKVRSNMSLLLFILTVVAGLYWLAERFYFRRQRVAAADALASSVAQRHADAKAKGLKLDFVNVDEARTTVLQQPWWLEWTAGLFWVIAIVFLLRSFVAEPFRVPSGSMLPTIVEGDLILVNKFVYGVRLPVLNIKVVGNKSPQRGDIMVFRLPKDPSVDYIKRVVGVPGDTVAYLNKRLTINGQEASKTPMPDYLAEKSMRYARRFEEQTGAVKHSILNYENSGSFVSMVEQFPLKENCQYSIEGVVCKVPAGHYFMMGDNRDDSVDSRFWGFVPEENIVGKAFLVWLNFGNLSRIGTTFE
jgi:signal peptidase I